MSPLRFDHPAESLPPLLVRFCLELCGEILHGGLIALDRRLYLRRIGETLSPRKGVDNDSLHKQVLRETRS